MTSCTNSWFQILIVMRVQKQHERFVPEIGLVLSTNNKINVKINCSMWKLAAVHTHLSLKFNIHVFKIGSQDKWGYWGLLTLVVIAIACFKFPFVLYRRCKSYWDGWVEYINIPLAFRVLHFRYNYKLGFICLESPWFMVNWVLQPTSKSSNLETSSQVEPLKFQSIVFSNGTWLSNPLEKQPDPYPFWLLGIQFPQYQ